MNPKIINSLPRVHFSGQSAWLARKGENAICCLFDEHGWREGWISKSALAHALYPALSATAAANYLAAMLDYLVVEGRLTREPQVLVRHGQVSFDVKVRA